MVGFGLRVMGVGGCCGLWGLSFLSSSAFCVGVLCV